MTNPLTTLDEIIWKQFEKVTIAANNRLGWDKGDLAEVASKIGAAMFIGHGTYQTIMGIAGDRIPLVAVGTVFMFFGGIGYGVVRANRRSDQEQEEKVLIETGTAPAPQFNSWRPLALSSSFYLFSQAASHLLNGVKKVPPYFSSLSTEEYNTLSGLIALSIGASSFFIISSSYFESQLPRPPSAKKSFKEMLTEYVSKPFHQGLPKPAEQPVVKYNSSPESSRT